MRSKLDLHSKQGRVQRSCEETAAFAALWNSGAVDHGSSVLDLPEILRWVIRQKTMSSDFHVIPVTEIHFFQIKC
jgi:hypothetical protein